MNVQVEGWIIFPDNHNYENIYMIRGIFGVLGVIKKIYIYINGGVKESGFNCWGVNKLQRKSMFP